MRTLGLLGGLSAESTADYYQTLNRLARERLGGLHSAELVIRSVDFAPIAEMQSRDAWDETAAVLVPHAAALERAGAEAILICANTMHLNFEPITAAVSCPVLHICDAAATALRARGVSRPLLLATRYTMEKAFYRDRLRGQGVAALVPDEADRLRLQDIIFQELVVGEIRAASKAAVLEMYGKARAQGCDGVIFGCTEIGLLVGPDDFDRPAVDTAITHCEAAMDFALG